MKLKIITYLMLLCIALSFSCSEKMDDLDHQGVTSGSKKELTESEIILKNQMAEAAKIIASIATDDDVLAEIVSTVKIQPQVFEDRVKFVTLLNNDENQKSSNLESIAGKFSKAFKKQLKDQNLKSESTILDNLLDNDIEINIPYPIEDYPKGTPIIITSHPMDNEIENIGYVLGTGEVVPVNYELTETNPVIIVWPSTISSDIINKSENIQNSSSPIIENKFKSVPLTEQISMENFNDENLGHRIYINYLYVLDDHRPNILFVANSVIYFGTASIEFDSSTKIVAKTSGTDNNAIPCIFSISLPPKYERYAKKGYSKGWYNCSQILLQDWQPAITTTTFAAWVDAPKESSSLDVDFAAIAKIAISAIAPEAGILSSISGSPVKYNLKKETADRLYGTTPMPRYSYKDLYNSKGTLWGEEDETTLPIIGQGQRPALQISPDLLYITTWETYNIN